MNEIINSDVANLELYSDNYPFRLPLRIKNFENESELKKFIKCVERMVRGSIEYKLWKDYIRDVLQIQSCVITNENMGECNIEIHHHIPSLFVLISALVNEKVEKDSEFSTFDLALETIELHYKNKIGYVALLDGLHTKFHNGFLTIPISLVKGDYQYFINNYSMYIDQDDMETIQQRLTINNSNCNWSRNNYPGVSNNSGDI